jgi:hypothetical protein
MQMNDRVVYKGNSYALLATDGGSLPSPLDFGMHAESTHTANHRGYWATYAIDPSGSLNLLSFGLHTANESYAPINAIEPKVSDGYAVYDDIGLHIFFNGRMRLAKDIDQQMHFRMGLRSSHDCSAYAVVVDFSFEDGRIAQFADLSNLPRPSLASGWNVVWGVLRSERPT